MEQENQSAEQPDLLEQFRRWNKELEHWGQWREEAEEAFNFIAGKQWSEDETAQMLQMKRIPVVLNLSGPMLDAVVGAEINGRQQVVFEPRGVEDGGIAEVLSKGADWIRDRADAETEESAAFRDAFICGMGWRESRMDYEEEPGGKVVYDHADALEVLPDPGATKPNAIDRRYHRRRKEYSKQEFREMWPNAEASSSQSDESTRKIDDPANQYDKPAQNADRDTVTVDLWEWFELEPVRILKGEAGELVEVPEEDFRELAEMAAQEGRYIDLDAPTRRRRKYFRAFAAGQELLEVSESDGFALECVTGLRDRSAKVWFGLVRRMKDPQKAINKLYSLAMHILAVNAKGGLIIEKESGLNQKDFEETYASPSAVTEVPQGWISGNKMMPKTPAPFPPALMPLFEQALSLLREAAGINEEMLGQVGRDQPGVLELQRKQAAYGILASFFDAFKRYRFRDGQRLLKLMKYLPQDTMIRVVGDDGSANYVPLIYQGDPSQYDVIVDEAPAGPNFKERTFQMMMSFMPLLQNAELPTEFWSEMVKYSPLPESVANKIATILAQGDDQAEQQEQMVEQIQQELGLRGIAADVAKKEADVRQTNTETELMTTFPDTNPQIVT